MTEKDVQSVGGDIVFSETADLEAWKVTVPRGSARFFAEELLDSVSGTGIDVMVCKADTVFGKDHLRSALYHARKAIKERRNSSESLAMETLLYASGERQLNSAIKKMAVDTSTTNVIVAQLSRGAMPCDERWIVLNEGVGANLRERLIEFGLNEEELSSVPPDRLVDLVLEKVASVDVLKK